MISKRHIEKKLKELNEETKYYAVKDVNDEESKIISSLKLTFSYKPFFYYRDGTFYDYIILKNKYFMNFVDNVLFIFDIKENKLIKRFTFLFNGEYNLYNNYYLNILKWVNGDNQFLANSSGMITLLELNENILNGKTIIDLKIIGYYNFGNAFGLETDEDNRFYIKRKNYDKEKDCILLY